MPNTGKNLMCCRVCGYDYEDWFPWGEDGNLASFEICDCCGVTFGYEDSNFECVKSYRKEWIAKGCTWSWPKSKPDNWSFEQQMKNIPSKFL